eukprot:UN30361
MPKSTSAPTSTRLSNNKNNKNNPSFFPKINNIQSDFKLQKPPNNLNIKNNIQPPYSARHNQTSSLQFNQTIQKQLKIDYLTNLAYQTQYTTLINQNFIKIRRLEKCHAAHESRLKSLEETKKM